MEGYQIDHLHLLIQRQRPLYGSLGFYCMSNFIMNKIIAHRTFSDMYLRLFRAIYDRDQNHQMGGVATQRLLGKCGVDRRLQQNAYFQNFSIFRLRMKRYATQDGYLLIWCL